MSHELVSLDEALLSVRTGGSTRAQLGLVLSEHPGLALVRDGSDGRCARSTIAATRGQERRSRDGAMKNRSRKGVSCPGCPNRRSSSVIVVAEHGARLPLTGEIPNEIHSDGLCA